MSASPELLAPDASAAAPAALAAFVHLHAAMLAHTRFKPAAWQLVADLAARQGCERVSLGLLDAERVVLGAVSTGLQADLRLAEFDDLRAAMEESLDQQAVLRLPEPADAPPRVLAAHALLRSRGISEVLTLPLTVNGQPLGAVTFEWRDTPSADVLDDDALAALLALVAPVLALLRANERPWRRRLADTVREALRSQPSRRWWLGGGALALVALVALPLPERVGARARVEGAVERALAAPAAGFLKAVHVRPGDRVQAGQLLAELAEQELEVDRRRLEGEVAQHESAYLGAIARSDRAQMGVALARMEEAKAQLELATRQIGRTRIEAPFDGVVIAGDLGRAVGAPVKRGDVLLTLTPPTGWRVIAEVDESDIARVQPGQVGQLALPTLPWQGVGVTVRKVTPVARAVEGANVFEVEAEPDQNVPGLRPGLQGAARFEVGWRPLGWRLAQSLWTQVRQAWWRLGF